MHRPSAARRWLALLWLIPLTPLGVACGSSGTTTPATSSTASSTTGSSATVSTATTSSTSAPSSSSTTAATTYNLFLRAPDSATSNCNEVVAVPRTASGTDVATQAMTQLVAGPTEAEKAGGRSSWFSAATAGTVRSVTIDGGTARVDFDPRLATTISGASSSCGSAGLLAQLDRTLLQFPGVQRTRYSLGGDTTAFYEWLQMEAPKG